MNVRMSSPTLLALFLCSLSYGQVRTPRVATVRYQDGSVRAVLGIPDNYIVGPVLMSGVNRAAFSDKFGFVSSFDGSALSLVRDDGSLVAQYPTVEARPVLGVGNELDSAIAWLPSSASVVYWTGSALTALAIQPDAMEGDVCSIRKLGEASASLLIKTRTATLARVVLSLTTGAIVSSDIVAADGDSADGNPFEFGEAIVSANGNTLQVVAPGTAALHFPISAGSITLSAVSSNSLQISSTSDGRNWLLHLENGRYQLTELPAPAVRNASAVK